MFHGYHATEVMNEHRRRVHAVTLRAHRHTDDGGRIVRRTTLPWWRRLTGTARLDPRAVYDVAPSTG